MSKEAIEHYEAALKEAFPSGATGDVFHHWNEARKALAEQPAQQLPVGVGGGLVAIKTLLSRDPCAHAKLAIEMIDAMLSEQPAQQEPVAWADECRISLVTAIHFLASDYENALGVFRDDTEARRKAEGDIAYARKIAAKWNWNGASPPAQRKPLTRKQLADAWIGTAHITHATERQIAYARAIEAAHGIKGDA